MHRQADVSLYMRLLCDERRCAAYRRIRYGVSATVMGEIVLRHTICR